MCLRAISWGLSDNVVLTGGAKWDILNVRFERNLPMAIQKWSDDITVVELGDDPQFSDEMASLGDALENAATDVVLNFASIAFINSSNVAELLRLRKTMITNERRLVLCGVNTQVWGIFLVTGLDKIFKFTNDISTALTSIQLDNGKV